MSATTHPKRIGFLSFGHWHPSPHSGTRSGRDALVQSIELAVAAEELGMAVPAELSVLGFDGIRVDGLQHDLTTLDQPSVDKGRAAGDAVVRMLAGEEPESVAFTSTLHIGDTTARVRA